MRHRARQLHLPAVIFTFDHSPRRILDPGNFPGAITLPDEKFRLLFDSGVDWVVFRPFDRQFAVIYSQDFVQQILVEQLQTRAAFVGFNFGFGFNREGTAQSLADQLHEKGIECQVLQPVQLDGVTVSSTLVRKAVQSGDLALAHHMLGRPHSLSGVVVHGEKRGRQMGFPTANLLLENIGKVIPPRGVYQTLVDTATGRFPALTNIGVRPTFDRHQLLLEAHLLDFSGDLYSQTIRVQFLHRLREERRFPSMDALIGQIRIDLAEVRQRMTSSASS